MGGAKVITICVAPHVSVHERFRGARRRRRCVAAPQPSDLPIFLWENL